jgi:hypothetical protein
MHENGSYFPRFISFGEMRQSNNTTPGSATTRLPQHSTQNDKFRQQSFKKLASLGWIVPVTKSTTGAVENPFGSAKTNSCQSRPVL